MNAVEKCIMLAVMLAPALGLASPGEKLMSLEDALAVQVEGASRFLQPLSDAPADVTVISAADIRRFGYRTLAEALQSVPGVYATDGRDYSYLGIRGFSRPGDYNSRILLLADGVRRNDPLYNQAMVGNEAPIDLDWVKQIEFVPGAASALYGGNALFGIVNTVLWSGADLDGSRGVVELGKNDTARVSLLSGRRLEDGGDWVGGVSIYQSRGENLMFPEFVVPGGSDGVAHGLDGERYLKAFTKYLVGDWLFSLSYLARHKTVPTAYYGTVFNVPGNYVDDDYAYADISHSKAIDVDWSAYFRMSLGAYRFSGQYIYPGVVSRDTAVSRWLNAEYRLSYTGLQGHRLMFGAEAERVPSLTQRGFDVNPAAVYMNDSRNSGRGGLFAQDEWQMAPRWVLNMGGRADRVQDYGGVFSPRAALIFNPAAETSFKLIHGRAFRPANAYERFYNDGNFSQKANPDLMPERIVSNELVAKFPLGNAVLASANFYRYRLDHLIEQIIDPADGLMVFVNRPTFHARGIELEAEAVFSTGFRLGASLTLQQLRQDFAQAVNSPRRLLKLRADGPLPGTGLNIACSVEGIGHRATLGGAVPGYLDGNLILRKVMPNKAGEWSLGVYNLADRRFRDPAGPELAQDSLPTHDRQIRLRWEAAF